VMPSAGEEAHGSRPTGGMLGASGSTGAHGRLIRVRRGAGAEVRVELGGVDQRDLVKDACRHTRAAGGKGDRGRWGGARGGGGTSPLTWGASPRPLTLPDPVSVRVQLNLISDDAAATMQ
jgi:hypothetical protein